MSWQNEFVEALGGESAVDMLGKQVTACIADLIDQGCDLNKVDKYETSPVWTKVLADKEVPFELVEMLFEKGAVIPTSAQGGDSLLHTALGNEVDPKIIALLLEHGAQVSAVDENNDSVLRYAIAYEYGLDTIQRLVERGALVTEKTADGYSPILDAAMRHASTEVLAFLLDNGADVNDQDNEGESVLGNCCYGALEGDKSLELLISRGADVHHRNHKDYSVLGVLCERSGDDDMVEVLVKAGANLDDICAGASLLMIAAENYNTWAVHRMLMLGASNVNAVHEKTGRTALHYACERYNNRIVASLLTHGADHTIEDKGHIRPVDLITDEEDRTEYMMLIEQNEKRKLEAKKES